ncbi:unnamed protein product [Bursaphelenchus okinawaensis]|uniref:AMP-binding domain-containing protein n=1 Tax=Bursaphelenchus okinawaensis TaxID=465554 RepID=A0A811KEJ5_9BILA|nr:unnamed protein product [Bursaphelenchus okinawaensis]CAG9101769.1 unnamed protein product [Bursaphelenchus okinawaensis]
MVFTSPSPSTPLPTKPVHELAFGYLKQHIKDRPDQPIYTNFHTQEDVYGQDIIDRSTAIAKFLLKLGLTKGDYVVTAVENGWEYICVNQGASLIETALSGANPIYTEYELAHQITLCSAKVVLVQDYVVPRILNIINKCPQISTIIYVGNIKPTTTKNIIIINIRDIINDKAYKNNDPLPKVEIDIKTDVFTLPTSSGTTGLPKGVKVTHFANAFIFENFVNHFTNNIGKKIENDWNWRNEKILLTVPLGFVFGQFVSTMCMFAGARGIFVNGGDIQDVVDAIDKYQITLNFVSPLTLVQLIRYKKEHPESLKSIKTLFSSGGPIKEQVAADVAKYFPYVKLAGQLYGLTEAMCICVHDAVVRGPLTSVGRIMSNAELRIVDPETSAELTINQPGVVQVKVHTHTIGYINNPEANKDLFTPDGFVDTGDIGYLDERGFLFLVDRKKEMIKVGGKQVSPSELEDILMSIPGVKDCAVVGLPDPVTDERTTGFVVKSNSSLTEKNCLEAVNIKVNEFKQITGGIYFLDAIPRNPNGKLLRRKIKERFDEIAKTKPSCT